MQDHFSEHSKKILHALNKQREDGKFCDVTLDLGGYCLNAHRSILACCSNFFHNIYGAGTSAEVNLPESCSGVLGLLFDFIYTGELHLTQTNVSKVLSAAEELSIPDAIQACHHYQQKFIDDEGRSDETVSSQQTDECEPAKAPVDTITQTGETEVLEGQITNNDFGQLGKRSTRCNKKQKLELLTEKQNDKIRSLAVQKRSKNSLTSHRSPSSKQLKKAKEGDSGDSSEENCHESTSGNSDPSLDVDIVKVEDNEEGTNNKGELDHDYIPSRHNCRKRRKVGVLDNTALVLGISKRKASDPSNRKNEPIECPTCHKKFLSKYYLKVHNRKHTGEKPFKCSKCGKCYFRKENLLKHEARNCMTRTGVCSSCPQQFMQKKDMQSHMIKSHGAPKPFPCPTCSKCFLSRNDLHQHELSKHQGEKLFVCEECGHRASTRHGLQMHIKSKHRNERPYICEFCDRGFTQKGNLNVHLRTHTGEKPFQCHLCGKTFRIQASLDKHNRTHTGERPFGCEICSRRFTERGPLHRHMASKHQEGRPHDCNICGKTFKAIDQLRVHVGRHKGVRKFECSECGYKFTRQAHLRRHMDIHGRVENYSPRQRRLRNLIISNEKEGDAEANAAPQMTGLLEAPPPPPIAAKELTSENTDTRDLSVQRFLDNRNYDPEENVMPTVSETDTYVEEITIVEI
ncbi:telomere zinc finger-associated protein-like isoform X2 [Pristis pectinata]|uniref:telomere zinc finger-associated protein-like isoform X2 n=1 Tax=Pristis pectinata TaxID=685728 RepID=UPI00223DD4D2|nr:telomere zinc finger-associated protein-like isoform X2 [Pristis pectinata]